MKLNHNKKYTLIAIYILIIFSLCMVVFKVLFTWSDTSLILQKFLQIMAPFLIALPIAYFISPMVNFFEDKLLSKIHIKKHYIKSTKIKRILSITLSYAFIIGTIIVLLSIIVPQIASSISEISSTLPNYIDSLIEWSKTAHFEFASNNIVFDLSFVNDYISENFTKTLETLPDVIGRFAPDVFNFTKNIALTILDVLFAFVIAIYLLYNKESYIRSSQKTISAIVPIHSTTALFKVLKESHKIFSGFFMGKLLDSLIIGVLCFIILLIFNIPYSLLISVIITVTNMVPYFGPFIGGFIGILFLLISTPTKALTFAIIVLILQQFDGNILGPKILGDSTGLTPFWVIFSIILFGGLFGVPGMFLGVPCLAVIKNIVDNLIDKAYKQKMEQRKMLSNDSSN